MAAKERSRQLHWLILVVVHSFLCLFTVAAASDCRTLFFKEYTQQNKILENHVITNLTVNNEQQCRSECYNHHDCISYNTGPSPQQQPGMILCQLNNASRHQNPLDYKNKLGFTHRGAENPCISSPCYNNGTCQSGFTDKKYRCICVGNYTGERCKYKIKRWIQANDKKVCIGTKDDAFGTFNAPSTGKIEVIKLHHISGGVSWGGGSTFWGNFGDSLSEKFEIHITFPNKTRLAPPESYNYRYKLQGQKYNGKTLIYPSFKPWLSVQGGQQFNIWYGDDLRNHDESDNSGTLCVDVYLLYADY